MLSRRAFLGLAGGAVLLGGAGIAAERPSVRQWFWGPRCAEGQSGSWP